MNEKISPEDQIENFTKKLETPQITLLQIQNLANAELDKLITNINMEQEKGEKKLTEEEIKAIHGAIDKFRRKIDHKIFDFVDQ